jgi:hypothetical protein
MQPSEFLRLILDPGLALLAELGSPLPSDDARRFLLAVALQESGPKLEARYQNSPSSSAGPARGWWQFEQGGGVLGVLTHAATRDRAAQVCDALFIQRNSAAVWRAIEGNDLLAASFARLLLWTDVPPVPTGEASAWTCYADRLWRPGKPHPETWGDNWSTATRTVAAAAGVMLSPQS